MAGGAQWTAVGGRRCLGGGPCALDQVYIPRMGKAKEIAVQPRNLVLVYSPPRAEGSMAAEVDIAMADVEVTPVNPDDPETDHAVHAAAAEVASAFRAT